MKKLAKFLFLLSAIFLFASCSTEHDEVDQPYAKKTLKAVSLRYEAEKAILSGGSVVEAGHGGYSGTGYVNQKEGNISFTVNVVQKGKYKLKVAYLNNLNYKENDLYINGGKYAVIAFDLAPSWATIFPNVIDLNAGSNTIEIRKSWGWVLIDYIELEAVEEVSLRYEAENSVLTLGAVVEKSYTGYSGTGYVNQKGGDIQFSVNVSEKGKYSIGVRFLNPDTKKENDLYVNGSRYGTMAFETATSWTTITPHVVDLNAGSNVVTIKNVWGWVLYDYMDIKTAQDILFDISPNLVTPNSSTQTMKVYTYLKDNFGKKTLSGTMANYSTGLEEAEWVYAQTGKWPAITGMDFIDYTRSWNWTNYSQLVNNSKSWWNNNGIVTLMWHWRDPSRITDEFYANKTNFDANKIFETNSSEYKAMMSDIDVVAGYLKELKTAGIPILWRPLHEASGEWFWWGAKGTKTYKQLWKVMYDRLVNYHGLNNLIWIWTSETHANELDWYPGHEYVDIVGVDIYAGENQHGSQSIIFNKLKEFYGGKKILALSECGSVPDPDAMFSSGDTWSWFMPWNDYFTRDDAYNGSAYWNKLFSNTKVVTRDQMPSLK